MIKTSLKQLWIPMAIKPEEKEAFFIARNRFLATPRMTKLIEHMLDVWYQNGGGLFGYWHFSAQPWGLFPERKDIPLADNLNGKAIINYIATSTVPPTAKSTP